MYVSLSKVFNCRKNIRNSKNYSEFIFLNNPEEILPKLNHNIYVSTNGHIKGEELEYEM